MIASLVRSLALLSILAIVVSPAFGQRYGQRRDRPQGQQQEQPRPLQKHDSEGTVEAVHNGALQMKGQLHSWVVWPKPGESTTTVTGSAKPDFLKPGMSVSLSGTIDKKGALDGDINSLEIFTPQAKGGIGLFSGDKLVRNAPPGEYTIKGKVASFKAGILAVTAGGKRITGKLAETAEITVNFSDLTYVQEGDTVSVSEAEYMPSSGPNPARNKPGEAYAKEIKVTLAQPLEGPKKPVRAVRGTRAAKQPIDEPKTEGFGDGFGNGFGKSEEKKSTK